jgi:DNA repair exonuclease SbcCD nuclease subunit
VVRFIHTSDWQLGMTLWFLEGEAQPRYSQDRIDAIRQLGRLAVEHEAAFVVVAGDVFEHSQVSPATVRRALQAMRDVPVPVYLLPGNHDPLNHGGVWDSEVFTAAKPDNVHVLRGGIEAVSEGVEILSAPWPSKRPLSDLCAEAVAAHAPPAPGTTRILVGHGQIDRMSPDPSNPALIVLADLEAQLAAGSIHYVALGDRHSSTDVGGGGRIRYSGTQEPVDFNEVRPGKCLLADITPERAHVVELDVGRWRFAPIAMELASDDDLAMLQSALDAFGDRPRTTVKVTLRGTLSLEGTARLDMILEAAGHDFASIQTDRVGLHVAPSDADLEALRLTGFAQAALTELRERATEAGPLQGTARDALALMHRLAHGGAA